jgi:hypothetical protein
MKESRLVIKDGKAFLKVVFEKPSVVSEKAVQLWMERLKTMGQAAAVRKCALCGEVVSGEAILEACRRLGVEPRVELVHLLPQEEEKKPEMHESSHLAARLADRESYTMEEGEKWRGRSSKRSKGQACLILRKRRQSFQA